MTIPKPLQTETKHQFVKRCKSEGIDDMMACFRTWREESKKPKR